MPPSEIQNSANPAPAAQSAPAFVSQELSSVIDRTHEAAGIIVDFDQVRASEVGFSALLRKANVLRLLKFEPTEADVAEYSGIVEALTAKREESLRAAANEETVRMAA